MKYLNLHSLDSALYLHPFDGYLLHHLMTASAYEELPAIFPQSGFKRISTGKTQESGYALTTQYQFEYLYIEALAAAQKQDHINPAWIKLFSELSSMDYLEKLSQLTQINLADKKISFEFVRYHPHDFIDKHYDKQPNKVLTQLFYFNYLWDIRWGGHLQVLSSEAGPEMLSLPPWIHHSIILKTNPQAWHAVSPVTPQAQQQRLVLQVEWFENRDHAFI